MGEMIQQYQTGRLDRGFLVKRMEKFSRVILSETKDLALDSSQPSVAQNDKVKYLVFSTFLHPLFIALLIASDGISVTIPELASAA